MEERNKRRATRARAVQVAVVLSLVCAATSEGQSGRGFGDSALLGIRILTLDPVREHATITAKNAKHLVVLAVVPGREIEVIVPGHTPVRREREKNVFAIDMRRVSDEIGPADANESAQARLAYDRCMRQARATAERIAQQKARAVRRDSTGKVIGGGSTGNASGAELQNYEIACESLAAKASKRQTPTYLPARQPADRYLVVLASSSAVSSAHLDERLATLTAVAPDVATTIEAIAAGIYVGVNGSWAGYFVRW